MIETMLSFLGVFKIAFAQTGQGGPISTNFPLIDPLNGCDVACIVGKVSTFLIQIGGPLAAIMILIGGFYMVTAGGSSERFSTGKKMILYAAIGFAVILSAYGIANIVQDIFR